jgi:hypothetical protein
VRYPPLIYPQEGGSLRRKNMPHTDDADQARSDYMDRGPLSDDDLETAVGGSLVDIKPPTFTGDPETPGLDPGTPG